MAQIDLGDLQSHLAKVGDVSLQASVAHVGRQPVKSIGDKSSSPTRAQGQEPPGESPNPEGGQVQAHPPGLPDEGHLLATLVWTHTVSLGSERSGGPLAYPSSSAPRYLWSYNPTWTGGKIVFSCHPRFS